MHRVAWKVEVRLEAEKRLDLSVAGLCSLSSLKTALVYSIQDIVVAFQSPDHTPVCPQKTDPESGLIIS